MACCARDLQELAQGISFKMNHARLIQVFGSLRTRLVEDDTAALPNSHRVRNPRFRGRFTEGDEAKPAAECWQ